MAQSLPSDLSGYTKARPVGRGANGDVWLWTQNDTGRSVAVKVVELHGESRLWFAREVAIMPHMTHPATLAWLGFDFPAETDSPNTPGTIITEYMPNNSLGALDRAFYDGAHPAKWDATARSKAVVGIAAGMSFVHALNVMHGDLNRTTFSWTKTSRSGSPVSVDPATLPRVATSLPTGLRTTASRSMFTGMAFAFSCYLPLRLISTTILHTPFPRSPGVGISGLPRSLISIGT
jgi:serine/threonine protein kinase